MNQCAVFLMVSTCLMFVRGGVHLYSFTYAIHHSLFPPFQAALLFWGGLPLQFSLKQKMRNQVQFGLTKTAEMAFSSWRQCANTHGEPGVRCAGKGKHTRVIANLLQ